MTGRLAVCIVLLGALLPASASASQGLLLLADAGTAEWNAQVRQLAAAVDRQQLSEAAFRSGANADVQAAIDRLVRRGASEIVAVPLFTAAAASDLLSGLKSAVPMRATPPLNGDAIVGDIVLRRADEISANAATEVLLIVSHRSVDDDARWVPDLSSTARQLNLLRRFAGIVTWTVPPGPEGFPATELASFRNVIEREMAKGRRLVIVPVATPYGATESVIKQELQGIGHQVAKPALMPDERLVEWILSRGNAK